jgi:hypothetical protein
MVCFERCGRRREGLHNPANKKSELILAERN